MLTVKLGKTGIVACKNGFGALPVQRVSKNEAVYLLQKAFYNGVNYFDTARSYSDSEEKLGAAFSFVRDRLFIATKTGAKTAESFRADLDKSLSLLQTGHIDVYQFHNPDFCPRPGDQSGLYDAMLEAKKQGKIRFIGITNHRAWIAKEAVESGLYDTLQYPLSYLSNGSDLELVELCEKRGMGFIAMKALSGGLITDSAAAYAYFSQLDGALPIWGVQREKELDEFLSYNANPPVMTGEMKAKIESDRKELAGEFCRGCGYCLPCPAGIAINDCARMSLLLRRAPPRFYLTDDWRQKMDKIKGCLHCGRCAGKCPYKLDTPALLRKNYEDYQTFFPKGEA